MVAQEPTRRGLRTGPANATSEHLASDRGMPAHGDPAARRRVPYGVWIEEPDGGVPSFYLAHCLSHHGLHLRARHAPPSGHPLQMRLLVENERRVMTLWGEVAGIDDTDAAIAVRFRDLDEEHLAFLDELIAEGTRDQRRAD